MRLALVETHCGTQAGNRDAFERLPVCPLARLGFEPIITSEGRYRL